MDSIIETKDVEIDWASLGNICNDKYEFPEDLLESVGFKGVKLRERPKIYSILIFDTHDIKFIRKIDMNTPEMIEFMSKWFREKDWNI